MFTATSGVATPMEVELHKIELIRQATTSYEWQHVSRVVTG